MNNIFKITELSNNKYDETLVNRISPNSNLDQKGIHHLDSNEDLMVFDTFK